MPVRDFGLTLPQAGWYEDPTADPTMLVLSTAGDEAAHWLQAGQAMQRVLLVATVHDLVVTPMSQPLEIPALRELVTTRASGLWAQVVLQVGYGQATAATGRRPLTDMLMAPPS
jgi:hypothetical protein